MARHFELSPILLALGLTLSCARADTPVHSASAPTQERLVGVVTPQGTRQCDGSPEGSWVHPRHEIGFVRALGTTDLSPFEGRAVMVTGRRELSPESLPSVQHTGPCPIPMQMRSDWVEGPSGIRVKRRAPPFEAFRVRSVEPFDALTARVEGERLHLALANPMGEPLDEIRMTVHYEGCFGKPGSQTREIAHGALSAGATAEVDAPIHLHDDDAPTGRADYRAFSVRLDARADGLTFDLELTLPTLSVSVECAQ
ncbi:MAG: hypothetical protein EA397_13680 [Deltaproteobacteria bacterium]|nr:MAG: hypothetical protein EA397_13680 [Deltaproteobacteria bacterium]